MKGAYLLSPSRALFSEFRSELNDFPGMLQVAEGCFRITSATGESFQMYDRREGNYFEKHELPADATARGYCFAFLTECRSESLFCEVVKFVSMKYDFLVCDSDATLISPDNINPDLVKL